ncbi:MAG: DUF502 domain-containing protein [Melioribacteraceae bacterium]|nr:DUF502 domain-containing protein [Melioribacteraceae bacterium]MCF8355551.1 DUF502 domain-containing protein [Melioribacteraceae bacterium]MCF8394226.1 DUF502 domain-containing protein [Melioribacteraceae bacterium]MCF8419946.1 DUF502 domain-containing protein [Melioribacteraceae bacterium]
MERLKSFLKTTFLGGALVVLPVVLSILIFTWMFEFVFENIAPLTNVLIEATSINKIISGFIALLLIIIIFFLVGLIIKTRFGNIGYKYFEEKILYRVPGYKIIKETLSHIFGEQKTLFSSVALVDLYGSRTLVTAFVTGEYEDGSCTVFVPSGPVPTAGFIYHVRKDQVHKIDYPLDKAMRTVLSLGAGSKELLDKYKKQVND